MPHASNLPGKVKMRAIIGLRPLFIMGRERSQSQKSEQRKLTSINITGP
jgi:hypothetical protein